MRKACPGGFEPSLEDEKHGSDGPLLGFQAPQTDLAIIKGCFV